jgi:hypothetical protein
VEVGTVLCFKSTGELVVVIGKEGDFVLVRRPCMTHDNGITHSIDKVYAFELETVEEHLRHEAKEMVLKTLIQEDMLEAMEANKKAKKKDILVN